MSGAPAVRRLIVTGATGFIGRHAVAAARAAGLEVLATGRRRSAAPPDAPFVDADLHACRAGDPASAIAALAPQGFAPDDALLHLAWPGLPDFRDPDHLAVHLPADARFLRAAAEAGLRRAVIAGTCLEYGLQSGALAEDRPTAPTLPYPIAKDALRRWLVAVAPGLGLEVAWARLFYMFGPGQHAKSLLAQLDRAIDAGAETFPMSGGEQLRDYSPVEAVAQRLVALAARTDLAGVYNLGSGRPISVIRLVEERIAARGARIRPARGVYPYPDYEPMAFWADGARMAEAGLSPVEPERAL